MNSSKGNFSMVLVCVSEKNINPLRMLDFKQSNLNMINAFQKLCSVLEDHLPSLQLCAWNNVAMVSECWLRD